MARLDVAFLRAVNDNGTPVSGGLLYVFAAGTTTPATTYSNAAMTTANAHPVVADAAGHFANIYIPLGEYKVRVTDASGATLYEADDVAVLATGAAPTPADFGAIGNGSTDDGAALQAFFSALPGGDFSLVPNTTYRSDRKLTIPSGDFVLRANGATLDFSNMSNNTDGAFIQIAGTPGTPVAISAINQTEASNNTFEVTITTATAHGLAVGDDVMLSSDDVIDIGHDATNETRGQFAHVVRIISSTQFEIRKPMYEDLVTNPVMTPITWSGNFRIEGTLNIIGPGRRTTNAVTMGLSLVYCRDFHIEAVKAVNVDYQILSLDNCLRFTGEYLHCDFPEKGASDIIQYGLTMKNACTDGTWKTLTGRGGKHLFDWTRNTRPGIGRNCRFGTIIGYDTWESMAAMHGNARDCRIDYVKAVNCLYAMNVRAPGWSLGEVYGENCSEVLRLTDNPLQLYCGTLRGKNVTHGLRASDPTFIGTVEGGEITVDLVDISDATGNAVHFDFSTVPVFTEADAAVTGGSDTTITIAALPVAMYNNDGALVGAQIVIDPDGGGGLTNRTRVIRAHTYAGGVNTFTVSSLGTTPTTGATYTLRSFVDRINIGRVVTRDVRSADVYLFGNFRYVRIGEIDADISLPPASSFTQADGAITGGGNLDDGSGNGTITMGAFANELYNKSGALIGASISMDWDGAGAGTAQVRSIIGHTWDGTTNTLTVAEWTSEPVVGTSTYTVTPLASNILWLRTDANIHPEDISIGPIKNRNKQGPRVDSGAEKVRFDGFVPAIFGGAFTENVQAAIDTLNEWGGGEIVIPNGLYTQTAKIEMRSNVTVRCETGVQIDANGFSDDVIGFTGTVGAEVDLTADATRGDYQITASGAGFAVGDVVHLVSQRNALSTDAGDWRLGDGTANLPYCYFAEFNQIAEDEGSGVYRLAHPILFPDYLTTDAGETETGRTKSTVKKVTPVENAHWIGGEITRTTAGADVVDTRWAKNCTVSNVVFNRGSRAGGSIRWAASWNCAGINCETKNDPALVWDYATHHGGMNRYKTAGAQDCGFRGCEDSFGAQSVDHTYGDFGDGVGLFANVRPYCIDGRFRACFEACTSHPGCYREVWEGNRFTDCYVGGIAIRGLEPRVVDNDFERQENVTAEPASGDETYAVRLLYGQARRAQVQGNRAKGFYAFASVAGSTTQNWQWEECEISIRGNTVMGCFTGLETGFVIGSPSDALRQITYSDNDHYQMGRYIAYLGEYSAGVDVSNNRLHGDFTYTGVGSFVALVGTGDNCPALVVRGNRWNRGKGGNSGVTIYEASVGALDDTTTYPSADFAGLSEIADNKIRYSEADGVLGPLFANSSYNQRRFGDSVQNVTIASGAVTFVPCDGPMTTLIVDTEASAATDDLDAILTATGATTPVGHIVVVRTNSATRDVTLRDAATSGATVGQFRTTGDASFSLTSSGGSALLAYTAGNQWALLSVTSA